MVRVSPAVLPLLLVSGCSVLGADSCSVDVDERPAEVVSTPELSPVPEQQANVVLDVTSTLEESVRVTVRVDGSRVLDVELPGSGAACAHEPVYRYGYDLPTGPATVAVTTDQGQSASRTVRASSATRWLVVQVQDGFPLGLRVYRERPQWG